MVTPAIPHWPWGRLSLLQKSVPGEFPGGKCGRCVRLTTLPPSCAVVMKSENLNFLEPSGPLQACNGTALFTCREVWKVLQISPTRCTILLSIFISLLYMFRASMCPSSGENCSIYATRIFVTLYGWRLVCWFDATQPADQTPPIQNDKYQCRIDTATSSSWWAHGCPKHWEKRNK